MNTHPRFNLNQDFTHPIRFSIIAALSGVDEITFKELRKYLDLSDSVLSKQSSQLEAKGYLQIKKAFVGKLPQTKLKLTAAGSAAWKNHLAALAEIAGSNQ